MAEEPAASFGRLLKQLRSDAGLTQEELAEAATVSTRSVSDLERGVSRTAHRETARLMADALGLAGAARAEFEAVARGRAPFAGPAGATRTLPRDIASFTGRECELGQLMESAAAPGGVVGIYVIGGMAGVGKTAFAVHAAHQLAPRFPDGQLFLPLHGHTPGQQPVEPADALASLLLTAGIAAQQIPADLEARTGLWRDHLASKKLLLLLDDAADSNQVRPLLPGTAGSLVLITSRRHLVALEDARAISLDVLTPSEAAALLVRLAARPSLNPGDPAVMEIARLCGYLPLAVGMLAGQLHHHPAWSAVDVAADLTTARDRLELMSAENLSVSAAFDLSYADLTKGQQRLFRRLGLHPGTDVDSYAAAALDGTDLAAARRNLEGLYDHYLLTEPARGRYRLHDLIREHARRLADTGPASHRDAALGRLLGYYLYTARVADRHLARRTPIRIPRVARAASRHDPALPARQDAVLWMAAERLNLQAAVGYAARYELWSYAIAIPAAMHGFLRVQGHWDQALALHQIALESARQSGDRLSEAGALTDLGTIRRMTGDYSAATAHLTLALDLSRQLGSRRGETNALNHLGDVQYLTGDYPAATSSLTLALELHRGLGDPLGEASCLNAIGAVQALTGDYPAATGSLTHALDLYRSRGDEQGQASGLTSLGTVQRLTGDYPAATASQTQALQLHSRIGNEFGQASALNELGAIQRLTGDYPAATASQIQALDLFRAAGHRLGQASALNDLGVIQTLNGDYSAAISSLRQALELYGDVRHLHGQASALNDLGSVQSLTKDYPAATASLRQALKIYTGLGHRQGEAVLNNMGEMALAFAKTHDADSSHQKALAIAISITAPAEEARALEGIGRCQLLNGETAQGAASLRRSLEIYEQISSPNTQRVATLLQDQHL